MLWQHSSNSFYLNKVKDLSHSEHKLSDPLQAGRMPSSGVVRCHRFGGKKAQDHLANTLAAAVRIQARLGATARPDRKLPITWHYALTLDQGSGDRSRCGWGASSRTFHDEAPSSSRIGRPATIAGSSMLRRFTAPMSEPSGRLSALS